MLAAADAIAEHLERGSLTGGLVFDAVRVRLIEIGAHRHFDTVHAIVAATVEHDLPPLAAAARRLLDAIDD